MSAPLRVDDLHRQPGTAKVTVAWLIAAICARFARPVLLHPIEVTWISLADVLVGQADPQVTAAPAPALGEVFFIDEAAPTPAPLPSNSRARAALRGY